MEKVIHKESGKEYTYFKPVSNKTTDEVMIFYTDGVNFYVRTKNNFFDKFEILETPEKYDIIKYFHDLANNKLWALKRQEELLDKVSKFICNIYQNMIAFRLEKYFNLSMFFTSLRKINGKICQG
ncbi:hypothetical protein LOS1_00104 [Campylobacter phage vB_CjeM_Los1]|uniref:Uncharacterized protein n=1 Tax=Campylobacter phage vB_CjeM_Los1 TaxID=1904491 RepID=A0A1D8EXK1_9CAUD|nr:hypothetical protein FDH13_gp104 [Campylobacter phage vB_CjeM_Los1]AOT25925.1 hypothetical protein LOS1_00104 [Campylobacter phage vB_CjeM_Los1]